MHEPMIGIKQLYKELPRVAKAAQMGRSFLVVKHNKPIFRIEPVRMPGTARKKNTLTDFERLQFRGGDRNISKKIDQIVYGL